MSENIGGVAEWLKAHAWKACLPKGNAGSNPAPSATRRSNKSLEDLTNVEKPDVFCGLFS